MKDDWPLFTQRKLIPRNKLRLWGEEMRKRGLSIATINGSFDILHAGHLYILHEASKQADILMVALNSDDSIKRYKGEQRPIIPCNYRLQMVSALEFVDYVTWFDEDDPRELLEEIKPDVHVNGSEYGENCLESDVVKKNGGEIHIVSLKDGFSTSLLLKKIDEINSKV